MKFMDHGLDDFEVLVKAALPFIFCLYVDWHLEPAIQTMHVVIQIKHIGEVYQLFPLHDAQLYQKG